MSRHRRQGFFPGRNVPGIVGRVSTPEEMFPASSAEFLPRKKCSRHRRQGFYPGRSIPDTVGRFSTWAEGLPVARLAFSAG
ncbi:hypothetical protein [Hoylesella saccharolytica]|uniref:hypothetical protein n=1 Tax=Hoylesella saccharolytica TaxID=633701 RepID=UPI0028D7C2F2|nr:hypothetical protein [Hoylesella saccharolytica]